MIQQPTEEFYDAEHSIITYALLSRACPDPDKSSESFSYLLCIYFFVVQFLHVQIHIYCNFFMGVQIHIDCTFTFTLYWFRKAVKTYEIWDL